MPTIIDSLVVEFALDPSKFNEGQRRTLEALRNFDTRADETAQHFETGAGNRLQRFFRSLSPPINSASSSLTSLGTQGRSTGIAVAAGASTGVTGWKSLLLVAGSVFDAFKSVELAIGSVADASRRGAAVSRAAWMIGLPGGTQGLDTLILAAQEAAQVPQETSINMLNAYRQRVAEQQRTGRWSQEFTELGRLGVDFSAPMMQQLTQVREAMRQMVAAGRGPDVEAWINSVGLGPWLNVLKLSEAEWQNFTRIAQRHALSDAMSEDMKRAQTSTTQFENSVVHLWEVLATKFSRAGFSSALDGWSALADAISHAVEGEENFDKKTQDLDRGAFKVIGDWLDGLVQKLIAATLTTMFPWLAPFFAMWPKAAGDASENDFRKRPLPPGAFPGSTGGVTAAPTPGRPAAGGVSAGAEQYGSLADYWASYYGLNPSETAGWKAAIQGESSWNPRALSDKGAIGLGQVMPFHAREFGMEPGDLWDPSNNLRASAKIWHDAWIAAGGDPAGAAAHYYSKTGSSYPNYTRSVVHASQGAGSAMSSILAIGDSIAAGLAAAGRMGERTSQAGYGGQGSPSDRDDASYAAVYGRDPAQVLAAIKGLDPNAVRGKTVLLSSGVSNDPTQIALVTQQIDALKALGAKVELVGVGGSIPHADASKINEQLRAIAASRNVPFGGPLSTAEGRVHPRDYGANLRDELSLIRSFYGGTAMTKSVTNDVDVNGGIHVHTAAATDARGVASAVHGALKDQLKRNSIVSSANSGLS